MNTLEIYFWKFAKYLIRHGYGYEEKDKRDGMSVDVQGRCVGCAASEVQDWISSHIELLEEN